MIKPSDSRYKDFVTDPDQTKPVIESYDEYMKLAMESAIAEYMSSQEGEFDWNKVINERYGLNRGAEFVNMRTFNKELLVRAPLATEIIEMQSRLDEYISLCEDPAKKTMAMAVRQVTEPHFNSLLEHELVTTCRAQMAALGKDYIVPEAIRADLDARLAAENVKDANKDHLETCDFGLLPNDDQYELMSRYVKSFFDREAMDGVDLNNATTADKQFLTMLGEAANRLTTAAEAGDKKTANALKDRDARDFNALSSMCQNMSADEKDKYEKAVAEFKSGADFAKMDVTVKRDHLDLTLINSPMIEITAEEFLSKQKAGTLSAMEIEWGEASVDAMVKSLYTDDEYRDLVRAGYDPAMGIMVDGKPLDWFSYISTKENIADSRVSNTAKQKCNVIAQALNGAKIDVYKFVPDGLNGFKKGEVVSVKTDLSMKTKKRSFWTWLKELLGFLPSVPSIKEKIKKANEANRDYLKTALPVEKAEPVYIAPGTVVRQEESEMAKIAKRDEATTRIKIDTENDEKRIARFDIEFFADAFGLDAENSTPDNLENNITAGAINAFQYKDFTNPSNEIIATMDRITSRVNMAILYGMTCGHTYDEMTEDSPEGAARRSAVGKAFIDEFSVVDYKDFIRDKELKDDAAGKQAYVNYFYDKREKVEKFTMRAVEAIGREPLVHLDPCDHAQFSKNYVNRDSFHTMVYDIFQALVPLKTTAIVSTEETKALTQRSTAVVDYMAAKLNPVLAMGGCARRYGNFMASNDFAGTSESFNMINVNRAAEAKAALNAFYQKTQDFKTYADILFDEKQNKNLTTIAAQGDYCPHYLDEEAAKRAYQAYLHTENRDMTLFTIYEDMNITFSNGHQKDIKFLKDRSTRQYDSGVEEMKPFVDTEMAIRNGVSVSEAFDEKVKADKQARNNVITFEDLALEDVGAKTKTEAAKEEKALEADAAVKSAEKPAAEGQPLKFDDIAGKPKKVEKNSVKNDVAKKPLEKKL